MSNYGAVREVMFGRIAMDAEDAALVEKYASLSSSWLEIGTLWGGSCLLAALANLDLTIICIDPMDGYYGDKDQWSERQGVPVIQAFRANLELFDISNRVTLIREKSQPWPLPETWKVDGLLIDGDHSPEGVTKDIQNAQRVAKKYILTHDVDDPAVNAVVKKEIQWGIWREIEACKRMRVFAHE